MSARSPFRTPNVVAAPTFAAPTFAAPTFAVLTCALLTCALLTCALLTCAGCSESKSDRIALEGHVRIDSQPVDAATLVLSPISVGGNPVSARVEQGRFAFTDRTGPPPGEYTVIVNPDEASIDEIVAAAEADPRAAARQFHASGPSRRRPPASVPSATIRVSHDDAAPVRIDLKRSH